jgi:hypothetical protein
MNNIFEFRGIFLATPMDINSVYNYIWSVLPLGLFRTTKMD